MWPFKTPKQEPVVSATTVADGSQIPVWREGLAPGLAALDGLSNVIAGIGTDREKRSWTEWTYTSPQQRAQLEAMYQGSWLAGKIVDIPVDDMLRAWPEVTWEGRVDGAEDEVAVEETRLGLREKVTEAMKWARLYGGAKIIMGIQGDDDLSKPLILDSVRRGSLRYLIVVDRHRIAPTGVLVTDPESAHFGQPETYLLSDFMGNPISAHTPAIHWSRMAHFDGKRLPWHAWQQNGWWHASELQRVVDDLKNFDSAAACLASMFFEANVDVIRQEGLNHLVGTKDGEAKLIARFKNAAALKSINHTLLLDGKETYERKSLAFSGLGDIMDKFMLCVAGAADIPVTRLFGQSPTGLSATGESDTRNYYDHVASKRESKLRAPLTAIYDVFMRSTLGAIPEGFRIDFPPLWQMSDKERADLDVQVAIRDKTYLDLGIVSAPLCARELKARNTYPTMSDDDVDLVEETEGGMPVIPEGMGPDGQSLAQPQDGDAPARATSTRVRIELTATAQAAIVTVNEARASQGLPPWRDSDGDLTLTQFQAKHAEVVAEVANAEAGVVEPPAGATSPAGQPQEKAQIGGAPKAAAVLKEGMREGDEDDEDDEEKTEGVDNKA